jgi:regulator of protease activity HflC (stomatin/prohibitin superfamily)
MVLSIFAAVFAVLILSILLSSLFTVQSGDAAVIQRFGKFHRTAAAGLGIKLPFVETKMTLSLRVQQADLSMESKTRDNVFVSIPVSIQYAVDPRRIYEAVYTLSSPRAQMEAIVNNILLGHIPSMEFDEV